MEAFFYPCGNFNAGSSFSYVDINMVGELSAAEDQTLPSHSLALDEGVGTVLQEQTTLTRSG